jgi:hypothetical protein
MLHPAGKSAAGGSQMSQEPELTFGGAPYAEDDSDADMAAAGNDVTNDITQQQQQQQQRKLRFSDTEAMKAAEDGENDDEGFGAGDDEGSGEQQQQGSGAGFGSVPLQHALPALMGHNAESLMNLRGAFFRRGGTEAATAAADDDAAVGAPVSPMQTAERFSSSRSQGLGYSGFEGQRGPEHSWQRPRLALLQRQQQQHSPSRPQQQLALYEFPSPQQQQQQLDGGSSSSATLVLAPMTPQTLLHLKKRQQQQAAAAGGSGLTAAAKIGSLLPAASAISSSSAVVDASLMLGRSFRPSWGPNGVLAIPLNPGLNPGPGSAKTPGAINSSGSTAEDAGVACIELRQLHPIAAVRGSSSSGVPRAAAAAAMQQRVLSGLELHLQYSSSTAAAAAAAASAQQQNGDDAMQVEDEQQQQDAAAAAAAGSASQWQLQLSRKQLGGYVQEQVQGVDLGAAAAAAGDGSDAAAAAAGGCGQHMRDLWQLVKVS